MVQLRQGVCSTNPNPYRAKYNTTPNPTDLYSDTKTANELHIRVEHIRKFYTDDTACFPVFSRNRNQYLMIVYHCDSNAIIVSPFKYFANNTPLPQIYLPGNNFRNLLTIRPLLLDPWVVQ